MMTQITVLRLSIADYQYSVESLAEAWSGETIVGTSGSHAINGVVRFAVYAAANLARNSR